MADPNMSFTPEFVRHARLCVTHRTDPSRVHYVPFDGMDGVSINDIIRCYFAAHNVPDAFDRDTYEVSLALLKPGTVPEGKTFEEVCGNTQV